MTARQNRSWWSAATRRALTATLIGSGACLPLLPPALLAHGMDEHGMQEMAAPGAVVRSEASYRIPDVTLTRADGTQVKFADEIGDGRPVLLDFIYTDCTEVCPVLSQIFSQVQERLGPEAAQLHMVTISIDPEEDTPAQLARYAQTYHAGSQWSFYTGTPAASVALQKAFDVYRANKMNHVPVVFLRPAPNRPWARLDGFPSPNRVVAEYRDSLAGL